MARRKHVSPGVYIDEYAVSNRRSRINEIPKMYLIEDDGIKPKHYIYMLKIIPNKSNIKVKETVQLQAMFYVVANNRIEKAEDVTKYCEWTSNGSHITVNNSADKGLVTVQSKGGNTIITAIYKLDGEAYSASAEISVKPDISYAFEVTPSTLHFMNTSETKNLTATYYKVTDGVNDSGTVVTEMCEWSSNDTTKFSVTNGKVRAKKTGASGTITAKYVSYSDTVLVSVESLVEHELVISATTSTTIELEGSNGGVKAIYYTIKDGVKDNGQDVTSSCTWNSSNPNNITVDKGVVKAVKSGVSSSISASYEGITSKSITFNVKSIVTDKLVISPSTLSMAMGDREPITATYIVNTDGVEEETTVTTNCEWFSTNDDIVVSKGIVEAKMSGREGIIYATYKTCTSNNCNVSVSSIVETKFSITSTISNLDKNKSYTLETQFITTTDGVPSQEVNVSCTWSSSDDSIISVNSTTGRITAITPGKSATITATYVRDGKTYTDSITISVNDEITYSLIVDPTLITINKDEPYEYVKAFLYTVTNGVGDNGTEVTNECTWVSSSNFITVDKGVVTGLEYNMNGYVEAIYTAPDKSELKAKCEVTVNAEPKIPITAVFTVTGNTQILFNSTTNIESVTWNDNDLLESTNGKITTANVNEGDQTIIFTLKDQERITSSTFFGTCLKSIDFPDSIVDKLRIISDNAFSDCEYLEEFTVPKNVNQLGTGVFSGSTSLTTVVFDGNVLTEKTIPNQTFKGCTSLTSVTLPEFYEKIGTYAFEECYALPSITLSNDCKIIDQSAFLNCGNLETVDINEGLTTIGYSSFSNCSKLKNIVLPESLETIGDSGFRDCKALENVAIHGNCKSIGSYAYYNCINLNNLTIDADGVILTIGSSAFQKCSSLETVSIPDRVMEIGAACFMDCKSLTTVTGLLGLTKINGSVFWNCESLVDIKLHSGIKSIGYRSFYNCNSLESTDTIIVEGVQTIGNQAFYGCDKLNVVISKTVQSIEDLAFTELTNYYQNSYCTSMYVDTGNTTYTSRNANGEECNCIMSLDRNTLYFGCYNSVIPEDIENIYKYAFYYVPFISLTLPEGLISIGDYAFEACNKFKNLELPSSLTTIGVGAFDRASSWQEIHIPENVTSIGRYAFRQVLAAKKITVDSNNTVYDSREDSNCIVRTNDNTLLFGCTYSKIASDIINIEEYAFWNYNFSTIVIPEGVKTIGINAFNSCDYLTAINIPSTVNNIGKGVFQSCKLLTTITVDSNNTVYDSREDCDCIVRTADNVLLFGSNKNVTIPNTIVTIGTEAFYQCDNITEIDIPDSVITVDADAFILCNKLTKITLGENVKTLNYRCFECSSLSEIIAKPTTAPILNETTILKVFDDVPENGKVYYPSGSDYSSWKECEELKKWDFIPQ